MIDQRRLRCYLRNKQIGHSSSQIRPLKIKAGQGAYWSVSIGVVRFGLIQWSVLGVRPEEDKIKWIDE